MTSWLAATASIPSSTDCLRRLGHDRDNKRVGKIFNAMDWFLGVVGVVTLGLGAIGIINIMLVSVTERTREIGLRKALGATHRAIMTQFFVEGAFLTALSGGIGLAITTAFVARSGRLARARRLRYAAHRSSIGGDCDRFFGCCRHCRRFVSGPPSRAPAAGRSLETRVRETAPYLSCLKTNPMGSTMTRRLPNYSAYEKTLCSSNSLARPTTR